MTKNDRENRYFYSTVCIYKKHTNKSINLLKNHEEIGNKALGENFLL